MSNDYKSSNAEIVSTEGMMFNEATLKKYTIPFDDFGILSNDNTYAVSFNPFLNKHEESYFEYKAVRFPQTDEQTTRTLNEPPVGLTDGMAYIKQDYVKPPPLLPPYLNKPESPIKLQGSASEQDKAPIVYGPKRIIHTTNIVF